MTSYSNHGAAKRGSSRKARCSRPRKGAQPRLPARGPPQHGQRARMQADRRPATQPGERSERAPLPGYMARGPFYADDPGAPTRDPEASNRDRLVG